MEENLEKELITQHICMTKHIGINNNLFGGEMLSWIDNAAACFVATKVKSPSIVTYKILETTFKNPIKVGHLVRFYGQVVKTGTTSITVKISAVRHNVITGKEKEVCEVDMVFVKVDADGDSCPI